MTLQAYIDDSKDRDGTFVLAGHIASVEAWTAFSKEWEAMLRHGTLNNQNKYHFKMSEMAMTRERMQRVPGFFRIIENHVLVSISCRINTREIERAKQRISVPGVSINFDWWNNPFKVCFRCLLDMFHAYRAAMQNIIPLTERVDFCFDNQAEKKWVHEVWDGYFEARPPETKNLYGREPCFKDDNECLPLQAADFWAWWVRKWYAEGTPEKIETCDFGEWSGLKKDHKKADISFSEDQLVLALIDLIRPYLPPGKFVYDLRRPVLLDR